MGGAIPRAVGRHRRAIASDADAAAANTIHNPRGRAPNTRPAAEAAPAPHAIPEAARLLCESTGAVHILTAETYHYFLYVSTGIQNQTPLCVRSS